MAKLTKKEKELLDKLAEVWNSFYELRPLHPSDRDEFLAAIHAAQNIIMCRPVARNLYGK